MDYVLVKYRDASVGTVGWLQMDVADARALFRHLSFARSGFGWVRRRLGCGLYWFCVVSAYDVHYWSSHLGWSSGLHLLNYV